MKAQTTTATAPTASPETMAFRAALEVVGAALPEVAASIRQELADQRSHLKLIASENFASPAVLLGGHSLMSGGLMALNEFAWCQQEAKG